VTEEVLSAIRDEKLTFQPAVVATIVDSNDLLRLLLDAVKVAVDESREVARFDEVAPLVDRLEGVRDGQASAMAMVTGGTAGTEEGDASEAEAATPEPVDETPHRVERDEEDLELIVEFLDESFDEIDRCEEVLNELSNGNNDPEFLGELFRKFHSIKGVASCIELDDITSLTHMTEELLSDCRDGRNELKGVVVEIVTESNDLLRTLMEGLKVAVDESMSVRRFSEVAVLVGKLEAVRRGEAVDLGGGSAAAAEENDAPQEVSNTWAYAEALSLLQELGESLPQWVDGSVQEASEKCYGFMQQAINEEFEDVNVVIEWVRQTVEGLIVAVETGKPHKLMPEPEIRTKTEAKSEDDGKSTKKSKETVKVDVELLAQLEALCGKLSEACTSMDQSISGEGEQAMGEVSSSLHGVAHDIRAVSARLRMVELKPVFQKMGRMVRDLSKKTEKLVKLVIEGEDTKVERKMAEAVSAPLVHMIRNAVDHGLESPDGRKDAGKPPLGTIRLNAYNDTTSVIVEITDDGKGLDKSALFSKALRQGLITEEQDLSDKEIYELIFHPGFSTAAAVTSISGRGVGMDVVRRDIESLGGRIEIDTVLGKGSTFKMVMPLLAS
jgi:two-component system chemotaxis sensor kinase CheA